jgi:hypothetical protein
MTIGGQYETLKMVKKEFVENRYHLFPGRFILCCINTDNRVVVFMKIFKDIILALWFIGMVAIYVHLFWGAIFPYDSEQAELEKFRELRAEQRKQFYENLSQDECEKLNVNICFSDK